MLPYHEDTPALQQFTSDVRRVSLIEMYQSKKFDVLSVFTTCEVLLTGLSAVITIELSPLVQTHGLTNCITFLDLALAFYSRISKIA